MEIISCTGSAQSGKILSVSLINEPIVRLTTSNSGRYRINLVFIKAKEEKEGIVKKQKGHILCPKMGIVTINKKNLTDMSLRELEEGYQRIYTHGSRDPFSNEKVDIDDVLLIDLLVTEKQRRFSLAFRRRIIRKDRSRSSQWSSWFQSEIPIHARLLFEISRKECFILDTFSANYHFVNRLNFLRMDYCRICCEDKFSFALHECGHGACTDCLKTWSEGCVLNCEGLKKGNMVPIRQRESACPLDACSSNVSFLLYPCRCVLTHLFNSINDAKQTLLLKICPYQLCNRIVENVIKIEGEDNFVDPDRPQESLLKGI